MLKIVSILFALLVSSQAFAAVWTTTRTWNADWEDRFSDWVRTDWQENVFISDKSKYKGIKTDCADATMAMRAVFAFENGLPFAFRDPTRHGHSINNRILRWDDLPPIQRFKKFMALVSTTISTRSLPESSLPVAMNSSSFRPGVLFVKPDKHSYQIKDINKYGIPITMSSTVPFKVRYFDTYEAFPAYPIEDVRTYRDGYRRFLLERELYLPKSSLPGYSLQQFKISASQDFDTHNTNSIYRAAISDGAVEPLRKKVERMMINICNASRNRVSYVNSALKAQSLMRKDGRRCMNAWEYDNFSTNSRDRRFANYYHQLFDVVGSSEFQKTKKSPIMRYAKSLFHSGKTKVSDQDLLEWCFVRYKGGRGLQVREIWDSILDGRIVSNPNATVDERWGRGGPIYVNTCPVY